MSQTTLAWASSSSSSHSSSSTSSTLPPASQQQHVLKARQNEDSTPQSQSLTFGFTFMAILLFLLFFAHMMQRVANRRQREVLARMAAVQESRQVAEVPKIWDVQLRGLRMPGSGSGSGMDVSMGMGMGMGSASERGVRWKLEERLGWKDMQPLSARAIRVDPDRETPASPHDRPLRVSVIIAMPISPTQRLDHEKRLDFDGTEDALPYFELGVTTIK